MNMLADLDASPVSELETRVAKLEAGEAIRALKARYAALADAKYTPQYDRQPDAEMRRVARLQTMCFTEEAIWAGGAGFGQNLVGREQLYEWFRCSPWCFAVHYYGSPVIEIDHGRARGTWQLWQIAMRADTREAVLLAGTTSERYARQSDGAWLCEFMHFDQIHMVSVGAGSDALASTFQLLDTKRSIGKQISESQ